MSSKIFKISAVAATVAASFAANAALYNVYKYDDSSAVQTYGVAISPVTDSGQTNCFSDTCDQQTSAIAYEGKRYQEGFQYRDESPFLVNFGFDYIDSGDNIYDNFRSYCYNYLGYTDSICENWANSQYTNGYANEVGGDIDNSRAYLENTSVAGDGNVIVNSINAAGKPVGNYQTNSRRNTAYADSDTFTDGDRSRAWAQYDDGSNVYTVGSVSTQNGTGADYTSKAAIWKDGVVNELAWDSAAVRDRVMPQGSARDIAQVSNKFYAVGYNSDVEERLRASVFSSSDGSTWTSTFVSGFDGGDRDLDNYLNSTLTAVSENGVGVGTYKLRDVVSNGAYSNGLFYVSDVANPTAKVFSGDIFFTGANGLIGGINKYDEVVGSVDFETHREVDGQPRAQRAFITQLTSKAQAPLQGKGWYLDNLTYGSNALASNNDYRIIQAGDINDAGVIAATAYYCEGGYASDAIDASCSGSSKLVAVKLVPVTDPSITERPVETSTVERSGGTLGFFALTLLGLLGFRRK
ncbi:hypothetical protein VIOR3934_01833 [Vibrio orientalis CIP 102891 = ATCC 33934]|uniref:GlyGly-CTERM sorting domain-containing protein n=1 Tax=Vibrio orientalis CIP 102891 = ATCC 33934 TaxID=675816 RepID=C9QI16_VIBOR|nr:DUF3466 family protein [Vibrio orientalis]EEX92337.1 hypothetical protein VIA_002982 [Vibrio orientalis CIP 102891 = ATCC 33934]EGU51838.1 hypothetical protein VIOR3934_01833 [Vibrio orientalis CIP 102891 = ATCC 33934]